MVKLVCAVVGEKGSAFPVTIDVSELVGDLKKSIALKQKYDFAANKLQLFLAKKGERWLRDDEPAVLQLEEGGIHEDIQAIINVEKVMSTWIIEGVLKASNITPPTSRQIHVLVVTPRIDDEDEGMLSFVSCKF